MKASLFLGLAAVSQFAACGIFDDDGLAFRRLQPIAVGTLDEVIVGDECASGPRLCVDDPVAEVVSLDIDGSSLTLEGFEIRGVSVFATVRAVVAGTGIMRATVVDEDGATKSADAEIEAIEIDALEIDPRCALLAALEPYLVPVDSRHDIIATFLGEGQVLSAEGVDPELTGDGLTRLAPNAFVTPSDVGPLELRSARVPGFSMDLELYDQSLMTGFSASARANGPPGRYDIDWDSDFAFPDARAPCELMRPLVSATITTPAVCSFDPDADVSVAENANGLFAFARASGTCDISLDVVDTELGELLSFAVEPGL